MKKEGKLGKDNHRLGRGLSALFQEEKLDETILDEIDNAAIVWLDPALLKPCRNQARKHFDKEKLEELAQSLKNYGMIEPIIVEKKDNAWVVIAGERRFRAAKLAGLKKIPALVRYDIDEERSAEVMLAENLQREDLTAIEEAHAFAEIMVKRSLTQQNLSEIVGKSRSYIANTLRLLKLPDWIQKNISEGNISPSIARSLVVMSEGEQKKMMEKISAEGWNARQVENEARESKESSEKKNQKLSAPKIKKDLDLLEFEKFFREQLKTKVTLSPMKKGIGKLELEYYSYDDLSDLLDRLKRP